MSKAEPTEQIEVPSAQKHKLNDVYITWKDGKVRIVKKSEVLLYVTKDRDRRLKGALKRERENITPGAKKLVVDGFFDPADFDQSNLCGLFCQCYTALTAGLWEVPTMLSASRTYFTLVDEIEEFSLIDDLDLTIDKDNVMWRWPMPDRAEFEATSKKQVRITPVEGGHSLTIEKLQAY